MSTTVASVPEHSTVEVESSTSRGTLRKVLLACGVAYSLSYVVANDVIAVARYQGYSRVSQAVSELSATGAPTRTFLMAMLPVWTGLMIAFGVGVWMSADGRRAIRVLGVLLMAQGVTAILWLPFPMTSRADMVKGATTANDTGHLVLTGVTVVLILAQLAFGAAALGTRFRIYSVITAVTVLVAGGLTGTQATKVADGAATPWMGLSERINIGAWLLWLVVLAVACWPRRQPADPVSLRRS